LPFGIGFFFLGNYGKKSRKNRKKYKSATQETLRAVPQTMQNEL
jgi:hypothetical protein